LKKLGEALTVDEEIYLKQYTDGGNVNFAKTTESSGKDISHSYAFKTISLLSDVNVNALSAVAAKQIENARAPR